MELNTNTTDGGRELSRYPTGATATPARTEVH